jgi:hypothetical protein
MIMKKTVDQFIALDAKIKELSKVRAALRTKLIGSRPAGTFIPGSKNEVGVVIVHADRVVIDSKAFKAELPELAARFSKASVSVSLRISDNHLKVAA